MMETIGTDECDLCTAMDQYESLDKEVKTVADEVKQIHRQYSHSEECDVSYDSYLLPVNKGETIHPVGSDNPSPTAEIEYVRVHLSSL